MMALIAWEIDGNDIIIQQHMQPIQFGNQYYPKFCNDRRSMCSIPKCYGASKPASKWDELVKLPSSQDAKVDLKLLIVSVIPIYGLSDIIKLFCVLVFNLNNKLITFSAS